MCNGLIIKRKNNSDLRLTAILFLFLMFLGGTFSLSGQSALVINVTVQQGINFGEFYPTTGGHITINSSGLRSGSSGVVLLPGGLVHQCVVNIGVNRNKQVIFVNVETPVPLTRVGGGGNLSLDLDADLLRYETDKGNHSQIINIGGTLHVGNIMSNPSGNYNGTFTITVNGQ
jgi:hypothetical protein